MHWGRHGVQAWRTTAPHRSVQDTPVRKNASPVQRWRGTRIVVVIWKFQPGVMSDRSKPSRHGARFDNTAARDGERVVDRRTLLKWLLAGGLTAPFGAARAAPEPVLLERAIPASGERLPAVGLGTSDEFNSGAGAVRLQLREVLRRFAEVGGKLIDTAPGYGNAETVLGGLLAELDLAPRSFIATKVRVHGRQAGEAQFRRSERLLNKRPLDLIQVHSLVDARTQFDNQRRWQDAGRVRYIGITHSRVSAFEDLERWMRTERLDFVQLNYSFTEPDAERRLLPLAADRGIAVIANRPFENGALFRRVGGRALPVWAAEFDCRSWAQFSLKYILAHPAVTCVIPATSNPRHLVDNMGAGIGRLPDASTRRRMRQLATTL